MLVNDDSGLLEIAEWCMNIVSVPVMIVLCVATVILTCLGVLWGNKIVKTSFQCGIGGKKEVRIMSKEKKQKTGIPRLLEMAGQRKL